MTINDGVHNTGYTVTGLANGTRYYFRDFARNVAGYGASSTVVSAIPRTITFGAGTERVGSDIPGSLKKPTSLGRIST